MTRRIEYKIINSRCREVWGAGSRRGHRRMSSSTVRIVEVQKKRLLKRRLLQAPIHSKCCIRGFRETGLALVIVLRCDWPLCDIWFKRYEHFKIKMFLSVHTAGPWWIFQPKSSEQSTENTPVDISPPNLRQCQYDHDQDEAQPVLYTNGFYPKWHSCESFGCQCFFV